MFPDLLALDKLRQLSAEHERHHQVQAALREYRLARRADVWDRLATFAASRAARARRQ